MTQLTNNHWAVEVPDMATNFIVDMGYLIYKVPNYKGWVNDNVLADYNKLQKHLKKYENEPDFKTGGTPLPPGSWKYLFTTKEATEEDLKVFDHILQHHNFKEWFLDFTHRGTYFLNRIGSFMSFLISKGLPSGNNFAILQNNTNNGQ